MSLFDDLVKSIPEETKKLVQKQGDIAVRISKILKRKGITQREFANYLGMKESHLSKILSGQVNLTLKTIVRLEIALGENIVEIPFQEAEIREEQETKLSIY